MNEYDWPPSDPTKAEDWAYEHPFDAHAYSAGWTHSGEGYGPAETKTEWPDCPGFDFDEGVPDWSEITEEDGFEYRTVLADYGYYSSPPKVTDDGWELVQVFNVNPEPELYDEDGNPTGIVYIGEGALEVVYRRKEQDDEKDEN